MGWRWEDVDFEAGKLQVRHTLTTSKEGPGPSTPKTKGSKRSIALTKAAAEALRSHLERQLERD